MRRTNRSLPRFHPWILAGVVLLACQESRAGDWPQFLGPTRDGVYSENDLVDSWGESGPPIVWKKKVGQGFSGPVVSGGKLILFHRLEDKEIVECLEAETAKSLWSFDYP